VTLVLARMNVVVELAFELKMSMIFDALKLHALKGAINLVLVELCFKKLGDGLKHRGLKLLAGGSKFVMVVVMKRHIEPQEHKCV
jgi:hypothetical protein